MLFEFFVAFTMNQAHARKAADEAVNDHLSKTAQKKAAQEAKSKIELRKRAKFPPPTNPAPTPSVESHGVQIESEPNAVMLEEKRNYQKSYEDPGVEIQREVAIDKEDFDHFEKQRQQMLQDLRKNAEQKGYKVKVIPESESHGTK